METELLHFSDKNGWWVVDGEKKLQLLLICVAI